MGTGDFSIEYAKIADIPELYEVFRLVVGGLDIYNDAARAGEIEKFRPERMILRLNDDAKAISLARLNTGEIVGFCITDDQHGPIWIEWYGVHPRARRSGIGAALIDHLMREVPSRHGTKLWCDTRTNNFPSISLFEKRNFVCLCQLKCHWYGQDFLLWERHISTNESLP